VKKNAVRVFLILLTLAMTLNILPSNFSPNHPLPVGDSLMPKVSAIPGACAPAGNTPPPCTVFSDNFGSDSAIAGPVYSKNNPSGAYSYMPPGTDRSYPAYQANLYPSDDEYQPSGSDVCVLNGGYAGEVFTTTLTPVNVGGGSLSGTYYVAIDTDHITNAGFYQFSSPSATFNPSTTGELSAIVSGSNNALNVTVSQHRPPPGDPAGVEWRVFITTVSGAEVTGSDYFNITYTGATASTFTVFSLTNASAGVHGVGVISECSGWPQSPSVTYSGTSNNSLFVVTSERHTADTSNSLLMGVGDDAYDKIDTSLKFTNTSIPYPSSNLLQFSIALWLSGTNRGSGGTGVCSDNGFTLRSPAVQLLGDDLIYYCYRHGFGDWSWSNAQGYSAYDTNYFLTQRKWHVITITLDISQAAIAYYDLTIDGVRPSWVLTGSGNTPPFRGTPLDVAYGPWQCCKVNGGWWQWAWWLNTANGLIDLSRARLGNDGAFMYVDDVSITLTPTMPPPVTMTVSYSVSGGGAGYTAPWFNYFSGGVAQNVQLTTTATGYLVDPGSTWTLSQTSGGPPNPQLGGSSSTERWITIQSVTGTASAATIQFAYQHQYRLTMIASGPGTVTPASKWVNAGAVVTITATPNSGYLFNSWTGTGTGSYTGTSASHTITMNGTITESANFT